MNQYRNVALGELSPHVYAIAEQVHKSIFLHAAILKAVGCSHACTGMLTELCPIVYCHLQAYLNTSMHAPILQHTITCLVLIKLFMCV
jgi:hypothetical protein